MRRRLQDVTVGKSRPSRKIYEVCFHDEYDYTNPLGSTARMSEEDDTCRMTRRVHLTLFSLSLEFLQHSNTIPSQRKAKGNIGFAFYRLSKSLNASPSLASGTIFLGKLKRSRQRTTRNYAALVMAPCHHCRRRKRHHVHTDDWMSVKETCVANRHGLRDGRRSSPRPCC